MTLKPNQQLAHYRVIKKIDEGGMGEVYLAEDTKLSRQVALKVLPEAFVQDEERLARFAREAQMVASLNHPGIASIYGIEQADGIQALVLELVNGETLTQRIRKGPLPLQEAVDHAVQIAEALEAAHGSGIIHRDLKPGNIKFAEDGRVKVLDFGLAKAQSTEAGGESSSPELSMSPTLTAAMGTQAGVILGTAGYMSPEQARGKPVDRRADIWAFGVVLYEMLTGERLFQGGTATDIIAAVVTSDPDWSKLPADTPAPVRRVLRRCLEKDPRQRLCDMGDARLELAEAFTVMEASPESSPAQSTPAGRGRSGLLIAAGVISGLLLAALLYTFIDNQTATGPQYATWSHLLPPAKSDYAFESFLELSPDGRYVAFVAPADEGEPVLWVRDLQSEMIRSLRNTEKADKPFWSPDSKSLGFFAEQKLRTVHLESGVTKTIADASLDPRGGSWGTNGTILYVPAWRHPVYQVSSDGGVSREVTQLESSRLELSHRWPYWLPDGNHFLYYVVSTYPEINPSNPSELDESGLYLGSLDGSPPRLITTARSRAAYMNGHLLFVDNGTLIAQPFSLEEMNLYGAATSLAEGVTQSVEALWGAALFSASSQGNLLFVRGATERVKESQFVWRDRQGQVIKTTGSSNSYNSMRLSHDDRLIATSIGDPADLFIVDPERDSSTRFTFDPGDDSIPLWSPDDSQIVFNSSRVISGRGFSPANLMARKTAGMEDTKLLRAVEKYLSAEPSAWSPDGRFILVTGTQPGTGQDILIYSIEENTLEDFLVTKHDEYSARFSPDGRWLAYSSNESGRYEIFVQPFPAQGGKWQISNKGGIYPVWSSNGKELCFLDEDGVLMAATIEVEQGFQAGTPTPLFQSHIQRPIQSEKYDVSRDGKRFLFLETTEASVESNAAVTLITNWPSLLQP